MSNHCWLYIACENQANGINESGNHGYCQVKLGYFIKFQMLGTYDFCCSLKTTLFTF